MTFKIFKKENAKSSPWKNGLGFTSEIAIYPEDEDFRNGQFLWRISSAKVAESGPFSLFPDYDRWISVLDGEGLRLNGNELRQLKLQIFDGAVATHCELLNGPVIDFNIFSRKSRLKTSVKLIEVRTGAPLSLTPSARWTFLFLAKNFCSGKWPDHSSFHLSEGDSLLIEKHQMSSETKVIKFEAGGTKSAHLILIEFDSI